MRVLNSRIVPVAFTAALVLGGWNAWGAFSWPWSDMSQMTIPLKAVTITFDGPDKAGIGGGKYPQFNRFFGYVSYASKVAEGDGYGTFVFGNVPQVDATASVRGTFMVCDAVTRAGDGCVNSVQYDFDGSVKVPANAETARIPTMFHKAW